MSIRGTAERLYCRALWRVCEWTIAELERRRGFSPVDKAHTEGWAQGMESAAKDVYHYLTMHTEMTPKDIVANLRWQAREMWESDAE